MSRPHFVVILQFSALAIGQIAAHKVEWGPCILHFLEPCSSDVIQFFLFSSDRPQAAPVILDVSQPKPPNWVDLSKNFKIIIHGYGGYVDFNATRMIRTAYLTKPNTNIVVIDWGKLAKLPCYPSAAVNTRQAGECTARFLLGLQQLQGRNFQPKNVHAIGFSLGAHVASFASNNIQSWTKEKFSRITALDPALPFFATSHLEWKLDPSDATFVDVIHTNAGVFGKLEHCGHVDFYVNGGLLQPFCFNDKNQPLCSHMLAPAYFAESIVTDLGFWGIKCDHYFHFLFGFCNSKTSRDNDKLQWSLMGEFSNRSSTGGIYIVRTSKKPPFAMGLVWE